MPEKLREMQVRFYAEAAKFNVLPIQTSAAERFGEGIRPSLTGDRKSFTYIGGMRRIPEGASPNIKNRSWALSADVDLKGGESGVIATQGGLFGGWATPAAQASELIDVQSCTCAQFAKAMSYAKPVAKPTKKQEAFAVLAQDDLVLAMTWVNGYLAGRDSAKGAPAFTQDWVVTYMGKLSAICNANPGTMLLKDAVSKL